MSLASPDNEKRIIAIGNLHATAAEMFGGLTVNATGDIRVGSTDIHPQELGPALSLAVIVFNNFLEHQGLGDPSKDRAIIYGPQSAKRAERLTDAEKLGTQLYSSPGMLDARVHVLEEVVGYMRTHPNFTE